MSLSTDERKQIIKRLKEHTAVAEHAFRDALKKQILSEEELILLNQNLEIISLLKPIINTYISEQKANWVKNNKKYQEAAKSANIKVRDLEKENLILKQKIDNLFQDLINLENSEIYQLIRTMVKKLSV